MGVRGLSSFFDQNPSLSKSHKLHHTEIVIDGNNLVYMLYFGENVDCTYGGDYNRFADVIRKYFKKFLDCHVKPVVVFDGCYEKNDRKLATVLERAKERLKNAKHIAKYGTYYGRVLPILAMEVMRDVLFSIGVTCVQCDYEADDQITALANYYHCPVISQDSDFYIFDIKCGFIRLDSIEDCLKEDVDEFGSCFKYLECQIYFIDNFLSCFPGIDRNVLPLFATLIGNDFVHINTFDNFFAHIQLPKFKHKLKVSQRHQKMIGLLAWLKNHTLEEAINFVLKHLKMDKREQVRIIIDQAVGGYEVQTCFSNATNKETLNPIFFNSNSFTTFYGSSLPDWFVHKCRVGEIAPLLLNAICLHRVFLPAQVEDTTLNSSYDCSRSIRQVLYGILISYDSKDGGNITSEYLVEEYDRSSGRIQKNYVEPLFSIDGFGDLPNLCALNHLESDCAGSLVVKVIGDEMEYFMSLPSSIRILVGSIRFWLRNSMPKPSFEFFYSLIAHIIYFSIVLSPKCTLCPDAAATQSCDLDHTIAKIKPEELSFFTDNMKKYQQKPQHNNANPFTVQIVHSLSQLQTCLLCLLHLNSLLCSPFPKTKVHYYFGGTVLYNLTKELLSRRFPELFLLELFGRNSTISQLFTELKTKILEDIPREFLVQSECQSLSKKKKKKKGSPTGEKPCESSVDDDLTLLYNKFSSLCSDIECEK